MFDRYALDMLLGSPSGTTEAMAATHGISRAQLDRFVAAGKARVEPFTLVKPPTKIATFFFNSRTEATRP